MDQSRTRKPGDIILERILPDADPEAREAAREQLRRWMGWKLAIYMRIAALNGAPPDSQEQRGGGKMDSVPSPLTSSSP